jgi:hypothetical protein
MLVDFMIRTRKEKNGRLTNLYTKIYGLKSKEMKQKRKERKQKEIQ